MSLLLCAGSVAASACARRVAPEAAQPEIFRQVTGTWDWADRPGTCRDNPHTLSITPDGRFMLLRYPKKAAADTTPREIRYEIRSHTATRIRAMIVDPPEPRRTDIGEPVVWDLVMTEPNSYNWHRTDWPAGALTRRVVRCETT